MRFAFLSTLLLLSCYPHEAVNMRFTEMGPMVFRELPVTYSFSCAFPEDKRDPVRKGFEYWNKMVDGELFKESDACGVDIITFHDTSRALILFIPGKSPERDHVLATTFVGTVDGLPHSAVLRYYGTWADNRYPTALESAARHEAGHVLGFGHSDYPWCLMYESIMMKRYSSSPKDACDDEVKAAREYYGRHD